MSTAQEEFDSTGMGLDPVREAEHHAAEFRHLLLQHGDIPEVQKIARSLMEDIAVARPAPQWHTETLWDATWEPPTPALGCIGLTGAVLIKGGSLMISSEGGVGKSTLATQLALGIAAIPDGEYWPMPTGVFDAAGGEVAILSYEDDYVVPRLHALAEIVYSERYPRPGMEYLSKEAAERRVHLYKRQDIGPIFGHDTGDHIGTMPTTLPGWTSLWRSLPPDTRVLIIDPSLDAYVGDNNSPNQVRQFLRTLIEAAEKRGVAVIIIHHATKDQQQYGQDGQDEFDEHSLLDRGQLMGSGAWHDRLRGILTMAGRGSNTVRTLAVLKASGGQDRVVRRMKPIPFQTDNQLLRGMLVGFEAVDKGWRAPRNNKKFKTAPERQDAAPASNGNRNGSYDNAL